MSEELSFQIQLGLILPKMQENLKDDTSKIIDEIVSLLQAGSRGNTELTTESIKEIVMKDYEIFLDDCVLPDVEERLKPEVSDVEVPSDSDKNAEEAEITE
ncbi:MAG TPA: hypothetical protein QF753_20080 [Victivallales bacterium]|nr:hypothetical protein [Victivallales bacterium]